MDLRDGAIHQAVSPRDMERVRESFREIPAYRANPLPGVVYFELDLGLDRDSGPAA